MRILLVEDDPALGSAVRDYLARDGHAVDWVERAGAARACLPGSYAIVVLDLGLPDGDGLALLPEMAASAYDIADRQMGVNYGLNKVRFPSPVSVGSRLRGHFKLLEYKPIEGGAQLTIELSIEREGSDKPVCVAESVSRHFT